MKFIVLATSYVEIKPIMLTVKAPTEEDAVIKAMRKYELKNVIDVWEKNLVVN